MWIEYEKKIYDIGNMYNMRTLPMTYDFYLKNKMSAFEWKLNAMINKDRNLINNIPKIGDILLILNLTVIVFDFNNFFYINDSYIYH